MQISKNKVVSLTYVLHQDSKNGEFIEQTQDNSPLTFIYGLGQMLPKFEEHLSDLKVGDEFEFTLPSAEAYGENDPNAIIDLDKSIFMMDGKVDDNLLTIGNVIPMRDDQGYMLQGVVEGVTEDKVRMNFNHPMAGKTLHFTGKIVEVREATEEELAHGHTHSASAGCETGDCGSGCGCGCGC